MCQNYVSKPILKVRKTCSENREKYRRVIQIIMGDGPIIQPVIHPITIDTMVNNNGLNISDELNFVTCEQALNTCLRIFTARKRSLQRLCFDTCVSVQRGGSGPGGVPAPAGVWSQGGGVETSPRDGYCCGHYASYWNAFLYDKCDYRWKIFKNTKWNLSKKGYGIEYFSDFVKEKFLLNKIYSIA